MLMFMLILFAIAWIGLFSYLGFTFCSKNNAVGVVFWFLALFILGLIIGVAMLYNAKNNNQNHINPNQFGPQNQNNDFFNNDNNFNNNNNLNN